MAADATSCPIIPLLAALVPLLASVLSYVIAVLFDATLKGKYYVYPYDLLERQPLRGLYASGLGIGAVLTSITVVLRHVQILGVGPRSSRPVKTSVVSMILGMFMCISEVSMSAFSLKEQRLANIVFRALFYACSLLYMFSQAHISRVMPSCHSRCVIGFRISMSVISCSCILAYTFARVFLSSYDENMFYIPNGMEWMVLFLTLIYIGSFVYDLSGVSIQAVVLVGNHEASSLRGTNYIDHFRQQSSRKYSYSAHAAETSRIARGGNDNGHPSVPGLGSLGGSALSFEAMEPPPTYSRSEFPGFSSPTRNSIEMSPETRFSRSFPPSDALQPSEGVIISDGRTSLIATQHFPGHEHQRVYSSSNGHIPAHVSAVVIKENTGGNQPIGTKYVGYAPPNEGSDRSVMVKKFSLARVDRPRSVNSLIEATEMANF